jgi:hypothetical protein
VLNLICGTSDENGHSEASCPNQSQCMNCNRGHLCSDKVLPSVYEREVHTGTLESRRVIPFLFLDEQVQMQESKTRTRNQFSSSGVHRPHKPVQSHTEAALVNRACYHISLRLPHGHDFPTSAALVLKTRVSVSSAFSLHVYCRLQSFPGCYLI